MAEILGKVKESIPTLQTYRKGPGEKIPNWDVRLRRGWRNCSRRLNHETTL